MSHIKKIIFSDVIVGERMTLTLTEFEERYHVDEDFLDEMLEHGLIDATPDPKTDPEKIVLDSGALHRVESALRLRRDLEVNMPGIALVLDLLEELQHARGELQILRRQVGDE
jgi:chaperone modulatory protein CbpM